MPRTEIKKSCDMAPYVLVEENQLNCHLSSVTTNSFYKLNAMTALYPCQFA